MNSSLQVKTLENLPTRWRSALSSDLAGKVVETYATRLLLMAITLVTSVLIARYLGPQGRGYYAVAVATSALGVQFGTLGLHAANAYFAAKQPHTISQLAGNTWLVSSVLGGTIAIVLWLVSLAHPSMLAIGGWILLLALLSIPVGLAYTLTQYLLLGLHDVRGYNLAEVGTKLIPLLLMAALIVAKWTTPAVFFGTTASAVAVCLFWLILRLRRFNPGGPEVSLPIFKVSIDYGLKAYLAGLFCFMVLRIDLFMVQDILGVVQAGYYSVASSMADMASVVAVVIGTILFPKLSSMTDVSSKLRLTVRASAMTALILFPMLTASALLAKWVVQLLFGATFLPAAGAFIILMPGLLFLGIETVAVQFLNSIGFPWIVVFIWFSCTLFNVAVNLWAIPRFGIAGASAVSSASYFLAFLAIAGVICRRHHLLLSEALSSGRSD